MQNNKYIEQIKKIILNKLGKYSDLKIIFFGSRAKAKNVSQASDVDIAIEGVFNEKDLIDLKESLEESNIPYEVDIINLNIADKFFKEKIYKEGIFWKN